MEAVHILARVHVGHHFVDGDLLGQRHLDDVAINFVITVEEVNGSQNVLFGHISREFVSGTDIAHALALFLDTVDVTQRRAVVTGNDDRQMWCGFPVVQQGLHFSCYFGLDCGGNCLAVYDCCHKKIILN